MANIKSTKTFFTLICILILAIVIFRLSWNCSYVGYYEDDAKYILLAKAMLAGKGYVSLETPGEPSFRTFPPGFPVVIMPFVSLVKDNYTPLKLINLVISCCSIVLCFFLFRNKLPRFLLLWQIFFFLTNNLLIEYTSSVMSDPLFLFLFLMFFIVFSQFDATTMPHWKLSVFLGILVVLCAIVRVIGVILVVPIFLLTIKYKDLKIFLGGMLPFTLLTILASKYGWIEQYNLSHFNQPNFVFNSQIIYPNFLFYLDKISAILGGAYQRSPLLDGSWKFFWLLFIPMFTGFLRHWKQFGGTWNITFICYFGVIILWPWQDNRLLLPLLPFLYYFIFAGIISYLKPLFQHLVTVCTILLLTAFSIQGLHWFFHELVFKKHFLNTPDTATFSWIKNNTNPQDIVLAGKPVEFYLFTGRQAIDMQNYQERYQALLHIINNKNNYAYITGLRLNTDALGTDMITINDYKTMIQEDKRHFRLMFQDRTRHSAVYKVLINQESFLRSLDAANKGANLYNLKRYAEAKLELQNALSLEPDFYIPLNLLGLLLIDIGDISNGINILVKNTILYPSLERNYVALAYAYEKTGNRLKAAAVLRKSLALAKQQGHHILATTIEQELIKLYSQNKN